MSTPTRTTRPATRTTPTSDAALRRAIEPVGAEEFADRYWEARPLHVERREPGRFDNLLSASDAERLITEPGLRHPAFRLVKADARLDVRDYTVDLGWRPVPFTGTADVQRLAAEYEAGATVVLQGLHLNWTPVARYCRQLEAWLGHPMQANAYLTPQRSQGLAVHHDTHDVFVLQVAGSKRWLVYAPALELPLKHQRYRPELGVGGDAELDVVLSPGDTLYLPRGWLHEALTSDEDSLHLTVGVNVHTWLDAFRAALDRCQDEVDFRRSADGQAPEALLERLAAELVPERVGDARRRALVGSRRPVLDGQLSQIRALDRLGPETLVERRATVLADLVAVDGRVELAFEGKRIAFPAHVREPLEHLLAADGGTTVAALPGDIDKAGRLVLVRRLVREGFLRVVS